MNTTTIIRVPETTAWDGSRIPAWIEVPCGNRATYDKASGIGYRCQSCFAIIGSVGQPNQCRE